MTRLLICYENDPPSANMKSWLMKKCEWEDLGDDGRNTYVSNGKDVIMTIDRNHISAENIDEEARRFGIEFSEAVFMSRHSAASGKPTLTVHPIGNYKNANLGGKERTLVRSCPHVMTSMLRKVKELNDNQEYSVSFEVTHHGPYLDVPTMFIEIGSEETHWTDMHAAEIMSEVILSTESDEHPVVIGVGGGHYAPRFTDLALTSKVDFGHMIPGYQLEGSSDDEIMKMLKDASDNSGTKMVYVHRKSMKGAEERHLNELIDSMGLERMSSKDFEPL